MPNHVTNRITAPKSILDSVIADHKNERTGELYKCFDFNLIIPQPEIIKNQESTPHHVKTAAEIALGLIDFKKQVAMPSDPLGSGMGQAVDSIHQANAMRQLVEGRMPKDFSDANFKLFIEFLVAWKECGGLMDWYDWNCQMWGTKWNSYSFERLSDDVVKFQTAWAAPHPVIERLVEKTKTGLTHEWADEDTGRNVGIREYDSDCNLVRDHEMSDMKEGYELAFELTDAGKYYEWNGVKYVYKEDEE